MPHPLKPPYLAYGVKINKSNEIVINERIPYYSLLIPLSAPIGPIPAQPIPGLVPRADTGVDIGADTGIDVKPIGADIKPIGIGTRPT